MKSRPNHHQCKSVKSAVKNSLPSVPPSSFHLPRLTASHLLVHMIQFLHTRIRVPDLDNSINFYSQLGFELGERKTSPQGNQLAFLNLPGNDHFLELTWSADYKVAVPEDLMHTAVGVENIIDYCDRLEKNDIEIWPGGWKEKFSSGERKMAFVTDPDGYEVEILER